MVEVGRSVGELKAAGIGLLTGAPHYGEPPSRRLKSSCAYVTDTCGESHVIAANEGGAVGWPTGKPDHAI